METPWKHHGNRPKLRLHEPLGSSTDFVDNHNMGWVLSQEICKSIATLEN